MRPAGASTRMGGLIMPIVAGFVVGSVPLMLPGLLGKTSDMKRQIRHDSAIPRGIVYLATNATKLWKKRKEGHLTGEVQQRLFHSSLPHFVAALLARRWCLGSQPMDQPQKKPSQQKKPIQFIVIREFTGEKPMQEAFESLIERRTCEQFEAWLQRKAS